MEFDEGRLILGWRLENDGGENDEHGPPVPKAMGRQLHAAVWEETLRNH
jgi:hypothetical protein